MSGQSHQRVHLLKLLQYSKTCLCFSIATFSHEIRELAPSTGHLLRDHELRPRSQWRLVDLCVDLGTIWEQDGTSMEYMEYCILNGSF